MFHNRLNDAAKNDILPFSVGKTPPSEGMTPDDWKPMVDKVARDLFFIDFNHHPLRGLTAFQSSIIGQFRTALDEDVPTEDFVFDHPEGKAVALVSMIRYAADVTGIDWRSPIYAESIMAVAQRAVAEELATITEATRSTGPNRETGKPRTWQDRMRFIVGLELHQQDPALAVPKLWQHFEMAMGTESSANWIEKLPNPHRGGEVETCMRPPYFYRMVLCTYDIDWYQPENRTMLEAFIRETIAIEKGLNAA